MDEEDVIKEAEELNKKLDHEQDKKKSPIWYIVGPILILLMILWIVPQYSVKLDPEPSNIPSLSEVVPSDIVVENASSNDYLSLVKPNDPVVKQIADIIVSTSCDSFNKACYAKAIFYFVRDNFQYVNDPLAYEYIKSPRESLVSGGGDCEDGSLLAVNLLGAVGIKTRLVFIPEHVYVDAWLPEALERYKMDEDWVSIDVTCNNCNFGEIPYQNVGKRKSYLEY